MNFLNYTWLNLGKTKNAYKYMIIACHIIALEIPAANPAIISSPITPNPPSTSRSILPIIEGFAISKYLNRANDNSD